MPLARLALWTLDALRGRTLHRLDRRNASTVLQAATSQTKARHHALLVPISILLMAPGTRIGTFAIVRPLDFVLSCLV